MIDRSGIVSIMIDNAREMTVVMPEGKYTLHSDTFVFSLEHAHRLLDIMETLEGNKFPDFRRAAISVFLGDRDIGWSFTPPVELDVA